MQLTDSQLRDSWTRHNVAETYDGSLVVQQGLKLIGRKYGISRRKFETIDCSTLISQAHWQGVGLLLPFLADNQRSSVWARPITLDEVLPGDLIFRYPGLTATRRHNHVALVAGWSSTDEPVLLESTEEHGVSLSTLDQFGNVAAVRRFVADRANGYNSITAWKNLAEAVPKLSRYNARLTAGGGRHVGFDIQLASTAKAIAPIEGTVRRKSRTHCGYEIAIETVSGLTVVEVGPLQHTPTVDVGEPVSQGAILGYVASGSARRVGCNTIRSPQMHLHIHVMSSEFEDQQVLNLGTRSNHYDLSSINALYAVRTGAIISPIDEGAKLWTPG